MLVSAVEQSESAVCVHICPLPLEPPSQPRLHPTPLSHHRSPSWVPVLYGSFPLTIYFTHGSVYVWASLVAQMVKNLLAMQETWVQFLGQEGPLEEKMATHSSILAWRIPWTEEPGGLQSMGWQRVESNWATNSFSIHMSVVLSPFVPSSPPLTVSIWMDLESVIQSEENQRKISCINTYIWNLEKWSRWTYLQGRNREMQA